jgi:hypothetical protein
MNKFVLKMEQPEFNRVVEVSFEEETLDEVVMQIDMFLKGCGYVFSQLEVFEEKNIHVDFNTPVEAPVDMRV